MTNRDMVSGAAKQTADAAPKSNTPPLPPVPAVESSAAPTTREEPIDSPQPNSSASRAPPSAEKSGLATKR